MKRFIEGDDRRQVTLLPESLDDYISEDNPICAVEAFVEALDLAALGFRVSAAATGRPSYHPAVLLKIYLYGYLNRIQSSRRLEREAQRNIELMWPDAVIAADGALVRHGQGNDPVIGVELYEGPMQDRQKSFGQTWPARDHESDSQQPSYDQAHQRPYNRVGG